MQPNPFSALLHSRKFLVAIGDALFSTVSIMLTLLFAPQVVDKILTVLGIWQPVIVIVIGSIAYEDAARIKAGIPEQPQIK